MSIERFRIINGSDSGHCCFKYSIVDTSKSQWEGYHEEVRLNSRDIKEYGFVYVSVCECFELKDAELVCKALNKMS